MEAQGWYLDPYGIHGDRWFSAGQPTPLVRVQESPPDSSDAKAAFIAALDRGLAQGGIN